MKIITSLIAVSLVASAITYVAMSGKKAIDADRITVAKKEQVTDEIAKLRRENQKLKVKASRVEIVEKEVVVLASSADSPEVIVDYLSKLEFKRQERGAGNTDAHRILVRQVIRQFEELTSMGSKALPSIADFLSRDVDLEFRENTEEITTGNWTRGQMYLDPLCPNSV